MEVLLLDRCDFPRRKACAGGLTIKAVRALRYSVEPVVRAKVKHIQVSNQLADAALLRSSQPVCLMTVREELDAFCLAQTIQAGAQFQRIGEIQSIAEMEEGVVLATGARRVSCALPDRSRRRKQSCAPVDGRRGLVSARIRSRDQSAAFGAAG